MPKEFDNLKGIQSYYKLVEEIRKEIIDDLKKLTKGRMRNFTLSLKIVNSKNINISKISRHGMIEKFDDKTDIIHSYDKLSVDLLAVVYDCFKSQLDDKDYKIEKALSDLCDSMAERGF